MQFTILSLGAFVIIGILMATIVPTVLESFVVARQRADAVVQANQQASRIFKPEDFQFPAQVESQPKFVAFFQSFQAPAFLGAAFFDTRGRLLYSTGRIPQHQRIARDISFVKVSQENIPVAEFRILNPEDQAELGIKEIFTEYIPITFGTTKEVTGVLFVASRTGFIRGAIAETQNLLVGRLMLGLTTLYLVLSTIVLRASVTISRQSRELQTYATGLEEKVKERTKALEESTKRELEKAAEVSRLKDEFVFIAAHELRLPAFVIKGNAELLKEDKSIAKLSGDAQGSLKEIERAGDRLQKLVNDLLATARLEYGTVKFKLEPTDILPVTQKAVTDIQLLTKEHGVAVKVDEGALKSLPKAMADASRLSEVLDNLLTNAVKFNKPKGEVFISGETKNGSIMVHVRDTGVGLTPEEQTHLFTKFWRASSKIEGTGLGLWITKHLVEKMEGEISAISEKGKGSTFTVKLKAA